QLLGRRRLPLDDLLQQRLRAIVGTLAEGLLEAGATLAAEPGLCEVAAVQHQRRRIGGGGRLLGGGGGKGEPGQDEAARAHGDWASSARSRSARARAPALSGTRASSRSSSRRASAHRFCST